ncbi:Coagulation factor IX [Toxocara canis]|uniref:Coagulation factor IX n=1 Tax=Toxocara canis TaxID=6265 RepID=A0A0B2VK77_TOXCA|nr:Coagulation factor IX [Toxocara canis]
MLGVVVWLLSCIAFATEGMIETVSRFYRLNESEWDLLNDRCGRNVEAFADHKISFGFKARQGAFPWAVKLFRFNQPLNQEYVMCTASIISQKHFITAAHCLQFDSSGLVDVIPSHSYVVLGGSPCVYKKISRLYRSQFIDCRSHSYKAPWALKVKRFLVSNRSIHFNMEENLYEPMPNVRYFSDIAIFELEDPLDLDSLDVRPICLPHPNHPSPKLHRVYGYGRTVPHKKDDRANMQLYWYYEEKILDEAQCMSYRFPSIGCDRFFITRRVLGDLRSTCVGDSGGGFSGAVSGRHYLYGVITYAVNYCDPKTGRGLRYTSIFANISFNYDFICYYTGICPMGYNAYVNPHYVDSPEQVLVIGLGLRTRPYWLFYLLSLIILHSTCFISFVC